MKLAGLEGGLNVREGYSIWPQWHGYTNVLALLMIDPTLC